MNTEKLTKIDDSLFKLVDFPYLDNNFDSLNEYEELCLLLEKLNETIDQVNNLIDVVDSNKEELIAKINKVKTDLEAEINILNTTLTTQINNLEKSTDRKLLELSNTLTSKIEEVQNILNNKIEETNQKLDTNIELINSNINDINISLNENNEKILKLEGVNQFQHISTVRNIFSKSSSITYDSINFDNCSIIYSNEKSDINPIYVQGFITIENFKWGFVSTSYNNIIFTTNIDYGHNFDNGSAVMGSCLIFEKDSGKFVGTCNISCFQESTHNQILMSLYLKQNVSIPYLEEKKNYVIVADTTIIPVKTK